MMVPALLWLRGGPCLPSPIVQVPEYSEAAADGIGRRLQSVSGHYWVTNQSWAFHWSEAVPGFWKKLLSRLDTPRTCWR
jgi:hypothetical protein